MAFPGIAAIGLMTGANLSSDGFVAIILISAPVFIILFNLGFTGWAINDLRDRFREMAAQHALPDKVRQNWRWRQWWRQFFLLDPG